MRRFKVSLNERNPLQMMSGLRKGELPLSRVNDNGVLTNPLNSRKEKEPWNQKCPDSLEKDITRGAAGLPKTQTSHQTTRPGEGDGFGDLRVPKGVSKGQLLDLKEAFDIFDQAKEGTITPAKLGNVMRSLGDNPTEAEVQDLILAVDDDGNGKIEFDEFLNMMSKRVNEPCRGDDLAAAFKVFDRSGTGAVTVDDLTDMVSRLGWTDLTPEELKDMIDVADEDGDKRVTLSDFVSLMKSDT